MFPIMLKWTTQLIKSNIISPAIDVFSSCFGFWGGCGRNAGCVSTLNCDTNKTLDKPWGLCMYVYLLLYFVYCTIYSQEHLWLMEKPAFLTVNCLPTNFTTNYENTYFIQKPKLNWDLGLCTCNVMWEYIAYSKYSKINDYFFSNFVKLKLWIMHRRLRKFEISKTDRIFG
jgi:hypothetical protein